MGCFWGANGCSGRRPGSTRRRSDMRAGSRTTRRTRKRASGLTGHTEVVLVVHDPAQVSYEQLLSRCSGRATTRRRACGRATTAAPSTARRSTGRTTLSARRPRPREDLRRRAARRRLWRDHHRDRRAARVLLRRGLPPAVPREGAERLLRAGRNGRVVPGGNEHRARVTSAGAGPAVRGGPLGVTALPADCLACRVANRLTRRLGTPCPACCPPSCPPSCATAAATVIAVSVRPWLVIVVRVRPLLLDQRLYAAPEQ